MAGNNKYKLLAEPQPFKKTFRFRQYMMRTYFEMISTKERKMDG